MRKNIIWLFLVALVIQYACTYDKVIVVDPEFQPFIERFRQEAAIRNVDVSEKLENISIIFGDIEESGISGTCFFHSELKDLILIDSNWWNLRLDFEEREHLIFHELGHCALEILEHRDDETDCNECLSYMRTNSDLCSANYYAPKWRAYYLDELFEIEPLTSFSWHECQTEYEAFLNKEIVLDTFAMDTAFTSLNYDITDYEGYEIEMRVTGWEEILSSFYLVWNDKMFRFTPSLAMAYEMDVYDQYNPYNSSKVFFRNDNINWIDWTENEMRFVVRNVDGFYTIFLNDRLIHKMDNEESNTLKFRTLEHLPLNIQVKFSKLFI